MKALHFEQQSSRHHGFCQQIYRWVAGTLLDKTKESGDPIEDKFVVAEPGQVRATARTGRQWVVEPSLAGKRPNIEKPGVELPRFSWSCLLRAATGTVTLAIN